MPVGTTTRRVTSLTTHAPVTTMKTWRCPTYRVSTLTELADRVGDMGAATLIVDAEPMLAEWDTDAHALRLGIEALVAELSSRNLAVALVVATNSGRPDPVPQPRADHVFVARARKPWAVRHYASSARPLAVVGDQPATDGLLAWRLDATYLRWTGRGCTHPPFWPRIQHAASGLLRPLFHERSGR